MTDTAEIICSRLALLRSFTVRLEGGQGNQMFQYAMGRAMSIRHQCRLYLEMTEFERYKHRPYALGVFDLKAKPLCDKLGHQLKGLDSQGSRPQRACRKIGRKALPWMFPKLVNQKTKTFEPELLKLKPSAYLQGFWQTEKYFQDIRPQLLEDFTVQPPLTGANLEMASQIQAGPSLSLHVRRGDYVSAAAANALHGTCSIAYYKEALKLVTSRCANPKVFIFSDDPQWTRQNICPDLDVVYVDHNGPNHGYEDMRLMSLCHHNITANSSFSWWGAWLNRHEDKIVCCPAKWYNDQTRANADIFANGWHQLAGDE